jgi:hypothetical protein
MTINAAICSELLVLGHIMEALGNVLNVFGVKTSNADSSISSHVNMMFFFDFLNHFWV